jgi:hypothetical protein
MNESLGRHREQHLLELGGILGPLVDALFEASHDRLVQHLGNRKIRAALPHRRRDLSLMQIE